MRYSGRKDTSPAPKALPKPEDRKRDLPYCTFEYSSYISQPCEHCTSQNISVSYSQASNLFSSGAAEAEVLRTVTCSDQIFACD